ncbi:hypothetical protein EAF04_002466 [Stromatinia cepivora]|nr:hypothetical protein EAF04_002466 [Stromatinia cepivora]
MELYTDETPAAIKNAPGLHLITENTPNGKKVQIMLEELKDVYNIEWTTSLIDLETDEQKKDWFLCLNPNDNTCTPSFPVMESSAELLYLVDAFDQDSVFGFEDNIARQSNSYFSDAISRFRNETLRIYNVLEQRLSGHYTGVSREFLAGKGNGKYSFADIGTWPWVKAWRYVGFTEGEMGQFPCLLRWIERIAVRGPAKRGISDFYDSEENLGLRVSTEV